LGYWGGKERKVWKKEVDVKLAPLQGIQVVVSQGVEIQKGEARGGGTKRQSLKCKRGEKYCARKKSPVRSEKTVHNRPRLVQDGEKMSVPRFTACTAPSSDS